MSKTIQIRNVPESLRRRLKAQAKMAGVSLSDYLLTEIRELAERPTLRETAEQLKTQRPVKLPMSAAAAVRLERDSR